jgi:hypothetical protein
VSGLELFFNVFNLVLDLFFVTLDPNTGIVDNLSDIIRKLNLFLDIVILALVLRIVA